MPPNIPQELGSKVSTRSFGWSELPERSWGSEFNAPDHGIYEFSNGRKFDSTDKYTTGIYGIIGSEPVLLDGTQYPDMRDSLQLDFGVDPAAVLPAGQYVELQQEPNSPQIPFNTQYPEST